MAKAWWRDSDYELFDRLTKERDEARTEVERLTRANTTLNAMLDGKRPTRGARTSSRCSLSATRRWTRWSG